jgi:hypothetical protein
VPLDSLSHRFVVGAPAEEIYAHLIDPHSYVGLSPLVVAVRDVRATRDSRDRDVVTYVAVERFRAGPLWWDNHLRVTMTATRPGRQLVSEVVSPGRVRLTATVDLDSRAAETHVTETIDIRSPGPLRRFVIGKARAVQLHRAAELTRRMVATVQ